MTDRSGLPGGTLQSGCLSTYDGGGGNLREGACSEMASKHLDPEF